MKTNENRCSYQKVHEDDWRDDDEDQEKEPGVASAQKITGHRSSCADCHIVRVRARCFHGADNLLVMSDAEEVVCHANFTHCHGDCSHQGPAKGVEVFLEQAQFM